MTNIEDLPTLSALWESSQVQSADDLYEELFDMGVDAYLCAAVYENDTLVRALWLYVITEAAHA